MFLRRVLLVAVVVLAAVAPVTAITLPAFRVQTLEGATLESASLAREGNWVIVYVTPRCAPCRQILGVWSERKLSASALVVIVGGATPDEAAMEANAAPHLSDAVWVADPDRSAAAALFADGAPVAIGFTGTESQWAFKGALPVAADILADFLKAQP